MLCIGLISGYTSIPAKRLEDDHGDDQLTSTLIDPNSSTAGTLNHRGDHGFFEIPIDQKSLVTEFSSGTTDASGALLEGGP